MVRGDGCLCLTACCGDDCVLVFLVLGLVMVVCAEGIESDSELS